MKRETTKSEILRGLVSGTETSFFMEAHDAISARIVERSGFPAIWGSGLSIASALGYRDANEASFNQVLNVLEAMADNTNIPILADGDSGWGNFNNVRIATKKLCQRGVAGICLEDKLFPKANSFVGSNQPLANVDEFCGKIRAAKDSQLDSDFVVVARVEALVSGLSQSVALERASAYHDAGADAILIHSKKTDGQEVLDFARHWHSQSPLIVVPTTYPSVPASEFIATNISVVIWANHNLRSAISAMSAVCRSIRSAQSVSQISDQCVAVDEVFDLFDYDELARAEEKYC